MEDEQNLDDSIDSVIIGGGQILNDQISDDNILEEEDECESRIDEECESSVFFGKLKFNWTIKEFSRVWQRESQDDVEEEGQKVLISKNFPCEAPDSKIQFQLKVHLRGSDDENGRQFMAVYLVYCGKDPEVRANFEIAIIVKDEKKNQRNSLKVCCFNEKEHPAWGFKKFIQHERLRSDPTVYFGDENSLTLRCTINIVSDVGSVDKKRQFEMEKERLAHPWTKFQSDLDHLWADSDTYSDVTFRVEGRDFSGHKVILSAGSPVMRRMFLEGNGGADVEDEERDAGAQASHPEEQLKFFCTTDENQKSLIILEDLKANVFEQVLRYIYTGTISDSMDSIISLLAAADLFRLKRLKDNCEKELILQLKTENLLEMLKVAEMHDAPNLKDQALDFLNKCTPKTLDWQQLAAQTPCILFDIMQSRFQQVQSSEAEDKKRKDHEVTDESSFPPATPQVKRHRRQ